MAIRPKERFRNLPKDDLQWGRFVGEVTATPSEGEVTDDSFADRGGNSVIGRSSNTDGKPADITLSDGQFLVNRGGDLTGGGILLTDLPAAVATDAEVAAAIAAFALVAAATYALKQTTGTYTGAFTGTTTDPGITVRWSKIGPLVMLFFPLTLATSNATTFTITGAPAAIWPTRDQEVLARIRDNGVVALGTANLHTDGVIAFGASVASVNFTTAGSKGVEYQTLAFSLD